MGIWRRMICVLTVALARGWGSVVFAKEPDKPTQ